MVLVRRFVTAVLLGILLPYGWAQAEEIRVAFVNTPQVLEQAPQAEAVRDILKLEFAPRDAELVAQQKALKTKEERLSRDSSVMSEEERRRLERDILGQQRELKRARDEFSEDLNIRRNEELSKMQREIALSIVALAKEKGYDLILESGVIYASDRVDITNEVIERLKLDYKKKTNTKNN